VISTTGSYDFIFLFFDFLLVSLVVLLEDEQKFGVRVFVRAKNVLFL